MEFLHPAALWGLLLAAVPIIIHLITRRKALPKPFAAIRFVLLSHQQVRRRLRLKRILILLARILAVVALALLVAHATLPAGGNEMHIGDTSRSLVIVVDNSMSMLARKKGGRPWDAAESLVASLVESIRAGHEAALLVTNPNGKTPVASLTADPGALRRQLDEIRPSFVYRPITDSLAEATGLLETARHDLRQIVLITDLARAAWTENAPLPPTGAQLVVIDVGDDAEAVNAAVANVELAPSAGEARYDVSIEIAAFAPDAVSDKEITVLVGEKARARGFLDLPSRGRAFKKLSFSATGKGMLRGIAHLAPDALQPDNDRFFTARAGGRISALIVDGDPKAERYGAESYYLMNALNPKLEARSRVDPTLVTATGLAKKELIAFDLVILANVGELEPGALEKLKRYVSEGGALLISLGDRIDPQKFASSYGDLAPAGLYILKEPVQPAYIDLTGMDHAAMSMFATPDGGDLSLAAFNKYYLLDPSSVEGAEMETVLRLKDSAPALVEKSYGRGKVALMTSTLDRDWNDLCIYPTYLPLLQQLALYLTGGMADPVGSDYMVGSLARFSCPADAPKALIVGPGNTKRKMELALQDDARTGETLLEDGPGFYEVYCISKGQSSRHSDREPDRLLVANVDIRESDLDRWALKALESRLSRIGFSRSRVVKSVSELVKEEGFKPGRRDAYRLLLAALLGMLLFEGFLTRKG